MSQSRRAIETEEPEQHLRILSDLASRLLCALLLFTIRVQRWQSLPLRTSIGVSTWLGLASSPEDAVSGAPHRRREPFTNTSNKAKEGIGASSKVLTIGLRAGPKFAARFIAFNLEVLQNKQKVYA